jgi:hypothetical protein
LPSPQTGAGPVEASVVAGELVEASVVAGELVEASVVAVASDVATVVVGESLVEASVVTGLVVADAIPVEPAPVEPPLALVVMPSSPQPESANKVIALKPLNHRAYVIDSSDRRGRGAAT